MTSISKRNVRDYSELTVDDLVLTGVLSLFSRTKVWTGTMTELNEVLAKKLGQGELLLQSPSYLRVVLNRVTNRLRKRGVGVKFSRTTDSTRTRYVKFSTR